MKKVRGITPYKPTSVVKNGVRYIVDEEGDMEAFRNLKRRKARAESREKKTPSIYAAALLLLQTSEDGMPLGEDYHTQITAADITEEVNLLDASLGITVADVRWAMAQPEAQQWFTKIKIKTVSLVGWEAKK